MFDNASNLYLVYAAAPVTENVYNPAPVSVWAVRESSTVHVTPLSLDPDNVHDLGFRLSLALFARTRYEVTVAGAAVWNLANRGHPGPSSPHGVELTLSNKFETGLNGSNPVEPLIVVNPRSPNPSAPVLLNRTDLPPLSVEAAATVGAVPIADVVNALPDRSPHEETDDPPEPRSFARTHNEFAANFAGVNGNPVRDSHTNVAAAAPPCAAATFCTAVLKRNRLVAPVLGVHVDTPVVKSLAAVPNPARVPENNDADGVKPVHEAPDPPLPSSTTKFRYGASAPETPVA